MNQTFEITGTSRKILEQILVSHTLEQLNKIPEGFKNNLIWNIGHIVVVQQMLVYKLSGLPMMVSDELVEKYKKGSQPEQMATQADVAELQSLLFETINQTRTDFNQNLFVNYQEFTTMSGFTLKNAQDAMAFNYYH
jgi:hypothetical protein